jgi:hypothetical protein
MPNEPEDPDGRDALEQFLHPRSRYYGAFSPERLLFDANLQEFTQRVGYICALETGGNLSAEEAYEQIRLLWKRFKCSKKLLEPPPAQNPPKGT